MVLLRHIVRTAIFAILISLVLSQSSSAQEAWELNRWFEAEPHFQAMERPYGESVEDYLSHWHNSPDDERRTIVIRWLGEEPPEELLLSLQDYLRSFFTLPVRIEVDERFGWPRKQGGKISAEKIQKKLERNLPSDAFVVIGLTNKDIFSEDNGPEHLLFGQGHYYHRSAVASLFRLETQDSRLWFHRAFKLVSHELTHTFSMEHCGFFRCLMNPSGSMESSDQRPLFLCPVCLRKMHSVLGFEPAARYKALLETLGPTLKTDSAWLRSRLGQKRR